MTLRRALRDYSAGMGTLYLVRHGQASLGAADYDQLSDLGLRQSQRLGEAFAERGLQFDAVLRGGLKRHAQTWAGIAASLSAGRAGALPEATVWSGLNEYDSDALLHSLQPGVRERPLTPEAYRAHFRLLRQSLLQWAEGTLHPPGMPAYSAFVAGVCGALDHVRAHCSGNVLIVSSGGPISTIMGHLLGTTPETTVELNLRIRNSSVTELASNPKRHMLVTYNTLPHLDDPQYASWVTYA